MNPDLILWPAGIIFITGICVTGWLIENDLADFSWWRVAAFIGSAAAMIERFLRNLFPRGLTRLKWRRAPRYRGRRRHDALRAAA